jgi:hypothetical protein
MHSRSLRARRLSLICATALGVLSTGSALAQSSQPIAYTLRIPTPATHMLDVQAQLPTDGRDSVVLMLPIWSPGFYYDSPIAVRRGQRAGASRQGWMRARRSGRTCGHC